MAALTTGCAWQLKVVLLPMEEQLDMQTPREIFKYYEEIVVQFGYIAMFGSSFPLAGSMALGINAIYLRTYAIDLLANTQRPPYQCASDIGAWQDVLNALALMAVVTNAGLAGLTGHAIYFYRPELSYVDRLWVVAVLEHVLLVVKVPRPRALSLSLSLSLSHTHTHTHIRVVKVPLSLSLSLCPLARARALSLTHICLSSRCRALSRRPALPSPARPCPALSLARSLTSPVCPSLWPWPSASPPLAGAISLPLPFPPAPLTSLRHVPQDHPAFSSPSPWSAVALLCRPLPAAAPGEAQPDQRRHRAGTAREYDLAGARPRRKPVPAADGSEVGLARGKGHC
jgi:hypothetical protein